MTTAHLQNIVAEKDARKPRRHGLSVDQVKSLGGILSDPVMVLDSISRDDAVVFVSDQVDPDGLPIVAVIRPNGTGVYEMTRQPANFLLSMYGREGFNDFIDKAAQRDKILYINKEKSQTLFGDAGVQFATGLNNADSNGILHQSRNVVKSESEERFSGAVSDSTPRFSVNTPLADQIAAANRQELPGDNAVYFGSTAIIMAEVGMDGSLPVLMTQQHIRDILHPKDVTNSRWHGLTEEQLAAIPEKLQNPVMVIDSMSKDAADGRVLFVTDMLDGDGLPIIAAVQAGGVGWYNMQITPTNMLLSVYGYGLTKDLAAFRSKNGLSADRNSQSFGNFVQRAMDSDSIL